MKINWGKALFIYFTIFLSLAAVFITFSFRQQIDLVDEDYYQKGATYGNQIEINNRSVQYTDSIKVKDTEEYIEFSISNQIGQSTESIKVHFFRPSDKQMDVKFSLDAKQENHRIKKEDFSAGRYIVKLSWEAKNESYYIEKDLFISSPKSH